MECQQIGKTVQIDQKMQKKTVLNQTTGENIIQQVLTVSGICNHFLQQTF